MADSLARRIAPAFLDYAQARHLHIDLARVRANLLDTDTWEQFGNNANATVSPIYSLDPRGSECCRFEDELINQFNLNRPPPPYDPQGPNSNTFVATIIHRARGLAVYPGSAFGFDYKPPR